MKRLLHILRHKRNYESEGELQIISDVLDPVTGMQQDAFGNRYKIVGDDPKILFSSHTDTVHRTDGLQKLVMDKVKQVLYKDDNEPLGADDGAGMWLMLKMIEAEIPGLYIFHRGEECGGLGSNHIATKNTKLIEGMTHAIAFDRRGNNDIITTQSVGKCASQDLAEALNTQLGGGYTSCRGSFTDTANYVDIIPECTNLSIGYNREHTAHEWLDYKYLTELAQKMQDVKWDELPKVREPGDDGYSAAAGYGGGYYGMGYGYYGSYGNTAARYGTGPRSSRRRPKAPGKGRTKPVNLHNPLPTVPELTREDISSIVMDSPQVAIQMLLNEQVNAEDYSAARLEYEEYLASVFGYDLNWQTLP